MINNRKSYILSVIIFLFVGISQPISAQSTETQKGEASWYGSKYHGKPTSSGELYNKNKMTAAHKTLPFGTKVKVTNLENDESVIVRINDRGPFVGDRIIDVSEVAAHKLQFHADGTGTVKVEVLEPGAELASAAGFSFEVASFSDYALASDSNLELTLSRN